MKTFYKNLMLLVLIPTLFLISFNALKVSTAATPTLNIGILAPYYLPEGGGAKRGYSGGFAADGGMIDGAIQAASEINNTGGININGTNYLINLIIRDEGAFDLSTGSFNTATTDKSMEDLVGATSVPGTPVSYIIGGFRTETTQEAISDLAAYNHGKTNPIPFFVCGSATLAVPGPEAGGVPSGPGTPYLYDPVAEPWVSRVTPNNDTMLFFTVADYVRQYLVPKLAKIYGGTVNYCVISEQLTWTQAISDALTNTTLLAPNFPVYKYLLGPQANLLAAPNNNFKIPVDTSTAGGTSYDFSSILTTLQGLHCHLILMFFTLPMVGNLVAQVYTSGTQAMLVGIDVPGQAQQWAAETKGTCNDESILAYSGTNTPIVPGYTSTFWNAFTGNNTGEWPDYCAAGAYDALYGIKKDLETSTPISATNRAGLTGQYTLTKTPGFTNDVYCDSTGIYWPAISDSASYGYGRSEVVQWIATSQTTGIMNTVSPQFLQTSASNTSLPYARRTAIPKAMYPLADEGDINLDGKVSLADLVILAQAFGSKAGDARWNANADINNNGAVDLPDLVILANHFGQSASTWPLP